MSIISNSLNFIASDGVAIAGSAFGDLANPAVLLLHGAGQTRHSWGAAARILAESGRYAITLDTRGHGDSDWSDSGNYAIERLVEDLLDISTSLPCRPAVVGASLGGLTALLAQGESTKELFSALVLVDVTPRIDRSGVGRIINFMKRHADGFESLDAAALAIADYQPQRTRGPDSGGLRKNLRKRQDGRYYWHWDPKLLDHVSQLDVENETRLKESARALRLPTLLVHGRMSDIVSDETAREFLDLVPHASYVDVQDAAHMVAGDDNLAFTSAVTEFLAGL